MGTKERLIPLVQLLASEMAAAFDACAVTCPPWRSYRSMLSKWVPAKVRLRLCRAWRLVLLRSKLPEQGRPYPCCKQVWRTHCADMPDLRCARLAHRAEAVPLCRNETWSCRGSRVAWAAFHPPARSHRQELRLRPSSVRPTCLSAPL